jgi:hypothetical protein
MAKMQEKLKFFQQGDFGQTVIFSGAMVLAGLEEVILT